jgi:hypothetical protein
MHFEHSPEPVRAETLEADPEVSKNRLIDVGHSALDIRAAFPSRCFL